jgi:hypothetical protein
MRRQINGRKRAHSESTILEAALGAEDKLIVEDSFAGSEGADFWSFKPVSLKVDEGGSRPWRPPRSSKAEV